MYTSDFVGDPQSHCSQKLPKSLSACLLQSLSQSPSQYHEQRISRWWAAFSIEGIAKGFADGSANNGSTNNGSAGGPKHAQYRM